MTTADQIQPDLAVGAGGGASLIRRLMAFLIDACLLAGLTCSALAAMVAVFMMRPDLTLSGMIFCILLLLFLLVFFYPGMAFFYFLFLHAWGGQTLGKLFMGIRVANEGGGPLSVGQSFLRLAAWPLSLLPLGAGFWASGPAGLAWHDRIACTVVATEDENTLTDSLQ